MTKEIAALQNVTGLLTEANIAVPIIFGTISAIAHIIKGVTGTGPSIGEVATMIEAQLADNDTFGRAEIARLKALVPA